MLDDDLTIRALRTYAEIAYATYSDAALGARQLLGAIDALLAAPAAVSLDAARAAWLRAREPYAQTEVFRFYDGPIDKVELWVNTWPIDESYVESAPGATPPGILQDVARYPRLSAELLTELNGRDSETAISTGYHVIEFLLWGRDDDPDGPGRRSFADFDVGNVDARGSAPDQNTHTAQAEITRRRGAYLRLSAQLLVRQLEEVRDAWRADDPRGYRARLLAPPPPRGLYLALKGIAKLSGPELSGERLTVPYETKNQEHEHSCFSDSTQADIVGDVRGIQNVCRGRYLRSDGTLLSGVGLCQALARALPREAAELTAQIDASLRLAQAIPAPFDRAILGADDAPGRQAVQRAARALRVQAEAAERIRSALGFTEQLAAVER